MPIFTDKQRGAFFGFSVGLATMVLSRKFFPAMKEAGRPLTKAAIKGGMAAYEKMRLTAAQLGEAVEDIVAEAVMESNEQRKRNVGERDHKTTESEKKATSEVTA
jgi:hypothetical protein